MASLFLKILNMSIAASYLVLAVALLRLALKKAPRWTFVLLWGIVALRLLCPFSIESAMSLIPSAEPIPESVLSGPGSGVQIGKPTVDSTVDDYLGGQYDENDAVSPPATLPTPQPARNEPTVMFTLSILWITGMVLMTAYTAFSYGRLHRKVATAVRFRDRIYTSEHVVSPFILGLFRPRIYLPYGLSEEELNHILAHEQAHIRRKDHWWKPLGFLLLTVHWFNPVMWVAYALLSRDIERACDEKVIRSLGTDQRADYSQTLLKCSVSRRSIAACPLAFGEVGVKERVKNVLNYKKPAFWIVLTAVIACIAVAVCFLTNPVTQSNAEQPQATGKQPAATQPTETQPTPKVPGTLDAWHQIRNYADRETGQFQLDAFPGVTFCWDGGKLEAVTERKITVIMDTPYIQHIAAADLNMDGYPEICVTADRSTEEHSCYVIVYDYIAGKSYTFSQENSDTGYYLYSKSGYLMCAKESLERDKVEEAGRLMLTDTDDDAKLTVLVPQQPVQTDASVMLLYDKASPDSPIKGQFQMDAFPGVTFCWEYSPSVNRSSERLLAVKDGVETEIFPYGATNSVYVSDVTGDGKPDFCANVYFFFSGLPSFNAVYVYDYANDLYYILADDNNTNYYKKVSYYVRIEDGNLVCDRIHEATSQVLVTGTLAFGDCETGKQMYIKRLVTYESPVYYTCKEENSWRTARLTTCADGTCTLSFGTDSISDRAEGTYIKQDEKLIVFTDDDRTYMFRFEGEDLIFVKSGSSDLPENSAMHDGSLLEATPAYP